AMSRGAPGARFGTGAGPERERSARLGRIAEIAGMIAVPAAAATALLAIAIESAREVDDDLQLVAPERAAAGDRVPIRAQLYAGLHRPEGPRLVTSELDVSLRARAQVLAHSRLSVSYARTLD